MRTTPIAFLLLVTTALTAQTSLPIKRITIFKNATAMVVQEGTVPATNGTTVLPIPDQTLFGAYFLGSTKDNSIKNIVFRNDTLKRKATCQSVWQYMAGNLNKPVTIYYTPTQGVDKSATGKITDYNIYTGMFRLVTDAGKTLVMHVGNVYQADFALEPSTTYMADSIKRMMVVKSDKPTDNLSLQQIFMTKGLNWIPSYFLKLKDDKNARIEMKATIENFVDDLNETETELVVGSPQMVNANRMDPMTYDYITIANGAVAADYNGGYMQTNVMAKTTAAFEENADYFSSDFVTAGEKNGDMYIYKPGKITLPYKAKGTFPIFAGNVDYKDKYEGTIVDRTNYFNTRYIPDDEKPFDVFHSLEIKNTSNVPLTTASVMVLNEKDQFRAQDELKYTPAGATTSIRLSKAIDIIMKNAEEEKTREDNAKKIAKTNYSKVILKGTVNIENHQNKEVTVTIKKLLNGTVTAQSDNAKISKVNSYSYVNPNSEIKWDIKLGVNEKKTLTYEYEVFFIP